MRNRDRINLALAAMVCGLAVLLWWPADGPSADKALLTDLDPQRIKSIRIEREHRLTLGLQRDDTQWRLNHPVTAAAEARRVRQLLAVAAAPVVKRLAFEHGGGEYGLEQPAAVLQLDQRRLLFGDRDPTRQYRYVRVDAEIRVIDDVYFQLLTLPASHFASDADAPNR